MALFNSAPVCEIEGVLHIQLPFEDPVPVELCESWACLRMHGDTLQLLGKSFPKYASTTIARTTFMIMINCLSNYFGRPDLWKRIREKRSATQSSRGKRARGNWGELDVM